MNATTSPSAAASPAQSASPLPVSRGRPRVIASWLTTSAPAARATWAVRSVDRESTTISSSTRATRSIRCSRMVDTIAPTVASSLRAGSTTLTRLSPLARSSRRAGQSAAEVVRYVAHASTTGETSVVSRTGTPSSSCVETATG